jgi:hypothetical protein
LSELPWAKAQLGEATTANAAITIKGFSMVPVPLPDTIDFIMRALCGDFCNQSSSSGAAFVAALRGGFFQLSTRTPADYPIFGL